MNLAFVDFASTEIQYPHVVSLSAEYCSFADLEPIVHCFPSLQDLSLHLLRQEEYMEEGEIEEDRLSNLAS